MRSGRADAVFDGRCSIARLDLTDMCFDNRFLDHFFLGFGWAGRTGLVLMYTASTYKNTTIDGIDKTALTIPRFFMMAT